METTRAACILGKESLYPFLVSSLPRQQTPTGRGIFICEGDMSTLVEIMLQRTEKARAKYRMATVNEKHTLWERRNGFVYLIRLTGTNSYKIGRAVSVEDRYVNIFGCASSRFGELIHIIPTDDSVVVEHSFHQYFRDKHQEGEFFELDGDDIALFRVFQEINIHYDQELTEEELDQVRNPYFRLARLGRQHYEKRPAL